MFKAIWVNSPLSGENLRLYLHPKRPVSFRQAGPTDEGWSCTTVEYRRIGRFIYREWLEDGRDCDGRLTTYSVCRWDQKTYQASWVCEGAGLVRRSYPVWERVEEYQRDYEAERMGY